MCVPDTDGTPGLDPGPTHVCIINSINSKTYNVIM